MKDGLRHKLTPFDQLRRQTHFNDRRGFDTKIFFPDGRTVPWMFAETRGIDSVTLFLRQQPARVFEQILAHRRHERTVNRMESAIEERIGRIFREASRTGYE